MTTFSIHHPGAFTIGILGIIISFMVYLAPIPTFYRIFKKKSTEGFQSVPYIAAFFSAMLWLYYAVLRSDYHLIFINSVGCLIEAIYVSVYIVYAAKKAKILTAKLLLTFNLGLFSLILLLTQLLVKGSTASRILGWVCVLFSVIVFAAPLSIMRVVMRTKSVEFMPFSLSFFLTLSAVMWFLYGLLRKDLCIAVPNILGFILGLLQMVLYVIYKNPRVVVQEEKLPHHLVNILKLNALGNSEVHPIHSQLNGNDSNGGGIQEVHEPTEPDDEKSTEAPNEVPPPK